MADQIDLRKDGTIVLADFPTWNGDGFDFGAVTIRWPRGKQYRVARNHADRIRGEINTLNTELVEARTSEGRADTDRINEILARIQDRIDEFVPKWLADVLRVCSDAAIPPDDRADEWRDEFPPYAYTYILIRTILDHWRSSPFASSDRENRR